MGGNLGRRNCVVSIVLTFFSILKHIYTELNYIKFYWTFLYPVKLLYSFFLAVVHFPCRDTHTKNPPLLSQAKVEYNFIMNLE